jgi:hypothetical protein
MLALNAGSTNDRGGGPKYRSSIAQSGCLASRFPQELCQRRTPFFAGCDS